MTSGSTTVPETTITGDCNRGDLSCRVDEWHRLPGATVQVRSKGCPPRTGVVDAATADGSIIWINQGWPHTRILLEKADGHEIWITPTQLRQHPR